MNGTISNKILVALQLLFELYHSHHTMIKVFGTLEMKYHTFSCPFLPPPLQDPQTSRINHVLSRACTKHAQPKFRVLAPPHKKAGSAPAPGMETGPPAINNDQSVTGA